MFDYPCEDHACLWFHPAQSPLSVPIGHPEAHRSPSPISKISFESYLRPFGNPKSLNRHHALERREKDLIASGKVADAIKIYLFMADGDQSLDAGYLGERLGECYEKIGDLHAAKYWYGRAVEENPDVRLNSVEARKRLHRVSIDPFLGDAEK